MWHLNLPLAPHFGGVHETMIKAAKRAVNAVLGNADVTDEESTTAFTGVEALLNSRPLTNQSANPEDDIPLTQNHFLIGQIGGQFAPESVDETNYSLIFSSAMPYFAFFSLFLNALLNDTFHSLLGIFALPFCITPLARLGPRFHSRDKVHKV